MPTWSELALEVNASLDDLLVMLEGNVATDHVEEQYSEGPDGSWPAVIAVETDPLRRAVHTCA